MTGGNIAILLLTLKRQFRLLLQFSLLVLYIILALFLAITSQLVGSNLGFVATIGFLFVFIIYFIIIIKPNNSFQHGVKLSSILFGSIGWKILKGLIIVTAIVFLMVIYMIDKMNIDIYQFRIVGFGTGHINSIDSRLRLFKDNFVEHFSYNPIFGNTQVDVLTTGEGTYIHSLPISLLTHTGVIGFALFVFFITVLYKEIAFSRRAMDNTLNANKKYVLFRIFALASVIILGTLSTFLIWIPLWFAIGLFGLSFIERTQPK